MPKTARRGALFSALSQQVQGANVFALEEFKMDSPKTKTFAALLHKLPFKRSVLMVLPEGNRNLEKSAGNLPNVTPILVNYLNVFDVLKHEKVMFLAPALKKAEELFLK